MRAPLLAVLPLLATTGCSGAAVQSSPDSGRDTATASAVTTSAVTTAQGDTASAVSSSGGAKAIARSDGLMEFKLSYPSAVGGIAPLARRIEQQAEAAEAEMRPAAREHRTMAQRDGSSFNGHYLSQEWEVVADLPRFLSLSNAFATYSGGAHGNYGKEALVWDRDGGRALKPVDLFVSSAALERTLASRFCSAFDRVREERRGGIGKIGGAFDECPSLEMLTVLLGSGDKRVFDRLTLYAGPYVAGPYAEGAYEIDLPIDEAVAAAVKPEYRRYFTSGG